MQNNPFCLRFGKEPDRYVERAEAYTQITESLDSISPSKDSFLIMGVRGSGKTVLLATIANEYRKNDGWTVISLNPGRDLLQMLAAGLYEDARLQRYFIEASLNLSKFGIGFAVTQTPPISDIQIAVEKMLRIISEKGRKVLITIDDVTKSNNVIDFASAYQDWSLKGLPVFLLMTGLYENVYLLQRDRRCSFLLRSEKILMKPLSRMGMARIYRQTFGCDQDMAVRMADFTKGYSYAFQVLGYIMWEKGCSLDEAIPSFDERMADYCYSKIWEDLSDKEKGVVVLVAERGRVKAGELMEALGLKKNAYSVYRDGLVKKGVLDGAERGSVSLLLPRFERYVQELV